MDIRLPQNKMEARLVSKMDMAYHSGLKWKRQGGMVRKLGLLVKIIQRPTR